MSAETPPGLPGDPVNSLAERAIIWHQVMTEYETAGFTHDEAFALTKAQIREYWSVMYEAMLDDRRDASP